MTHRRKIVTQPDHHDFEFDRNRNVIFFSGDVIYLTPHEAGILSVLLENRPRPTPIALLIQRIYGDREPGEQAQRRKWRETARNQAHPTGFECVAAAV